MVVSFPETFEEVEALPGIGRSTAGAILSLAFDQRHAILDGNVKRVLARHAAIDGWPGKTVVAKGLWDLAEARTPLDARVADYTQAIMDLGATLCTRSSPACERCPVASDCQARRLNDVASFPGKKPKKDKPLKQTTMLMAVADGAVYLERRPASGIWGGLWSLPEVEDPDDWCDRELSIGVVSVESWDILRHSFSHYDLDISPVVVHLVGESSKVADGDGTTWYRLSDTPPGGIAAPVRKLIDGLRNSVEMNQHG